MMRRLLSFKIWIPVIILGVILAVSTPTLYRARSPVLYEMEKSEDGRSAFPPLPEVIPINWTGLMSEALIGLGSLASIIRGVVEVIKLFRPKSST